MRIGTITFHWATNYGAVLQAYALQRFLLLNGFETEIINYIPKRVKLLRTFSDLKNIRLNNLIKEYKINRFRNKHLILSKNIYYKNSELVEKCHNYDTYICGSDQIWNEWFLLNAEENPTLSYYLNFVKNDKVRVSYATSFGTEELSENVVNLVKPELEKFKNIGVREITGKKIIQDLGLSATNVVDPTLLLDKEVYEELIQNENIRKEYQLFSYILHQEQHIAEEIDKYIYSNHFNDNVDKKYDKEPIGIIDWIYNVKNSKFVLTNSFHGVVFSIIFNTPFIVVPVAGSKMNDRIMTLLGSVGLEDRLIDNFHKEKVDKLMAEAIKWEEVNKRVEEMKKNSILFLKKTLCKTSN